MKVAVPDWHGRVSPVFDVAEYLLLVDLDREEDGQRQTAMLASSLPHERARQLAELGVDVLLCGAISWSLEALLTQNGIRVVPLVCGAVEEVVTAFREGTLEQGGFAMPGCCRSRRRGSDRRRRRRGGQIPEDSA